jgi:hypothetical protein
MLVLVAEVEEEEEITLEVAPTRNAFPVAVVHMD